MTDDTKNNIDSQEDIGIVPQTPVVIQAQYLKDLSFESPNSPDVLRKADQPPEVDINISIDMVKLDENDNESFYEVVINLSASAKREGRTLFIAEIKYGAMVSIRGLEESKHHAVLFIEVPRVIFPFVRLILSNATQQGGFVPLQIGLVDFRSMYLKRFGKNEE